MIFSVNIWAVLASTVVSMIIGSLWYGPLFGKKYMLAKDMDKWSKEKQNKMKKSMPVTFLAQFIANVLMFYVFAMFVVGLNMNSLSGGIKAGLLVWAGLILPLKLGDELWGGKMILFWLGAGSMLLTFFAAGAIIGAWN
jgi:mannitol-specific phosphotransferase system IIBC component